jgi:hypothetical protein
MKLPILLLTILILIGNSSCKKEADQSFSISGRVLEDCNMQPYANKEIFFFQRVSANWALQTSGGELGSTTTDANGNFKFNYKPQNDNDIRIQAAAALGFNPLIENIPSTQDVGDLNFYRNPRYKLQVSLNISNPRSVGDTLFITDYSGIYYLKFPCPLTNGVLYTTASAIISPVQLKNNKLSLTWFFKNSSGTKFNKDVPVTNFCGSDTTKVNIEIN